MHIVALTIGLTWQHEEKFRKANLLDLYRMELGYAVVKEYEYGMVNVRRAKLKKDQIELVKAAILTSGRDLKDTLTKTHESLFGEISEDFDFAPDPRVFFQFGAISRFIVARWILKEIMGHVAKRSP